MLKRLDGRQDEAMLLLLLRTIQQDEDMRTLIYSSRSPLS